MPRPPQGHPLVVQAGSSSDGKTFAAKHADVHFSIVRDKAASVAYGEEFASLLKEHGRKRDDMKILSGILPVVASSRTAALERQEHLATLLPDRLAIDLLSSWSGIDLSSYPHHGPMPELPEDRSYNGGRSVLNRVRQWTAENRSILEIARKTANTGSVPSIAGTPEDVADQMADWFAAGGDDGFNLMFPLVPEDWRNFTLQVVPILQKRGIVQSEYGSGTLRERIGLRRPNNRFAKG